MKREVIGQQGEVKIYRIAAIPAGITTKPPERTRLGAAIISHSEQGHHHVLDRAAVVEARTSDVPAGMRILYAIVDEPDSLRQDAATPHGAIDLGPGIYELRTSREYDPFAEQARRVAD